MRSALALQHASVLAQIAFEASFWIIDRDAFEEEEPDPSRIEAIENTGAPRSAGAKGALQHEREMAERIEQGIRQLRLKAGRSEEETPV
jgi:hypothetical protein